MTADSGLLAVAGAHVSSVSLSSTVWLLARLRQYASVIELQRQPNLQDNVVSLALPAVAFTDLRHCLHPVPCRLPVRSPRQAVVLLPR